MFQALEPTVPAVQFVSIASSQQKVPQALQIGASDDALDQPLAQATTAMGFEDENVTQPSKGCVIGHDAGKSYLLVAIVHPKAKRVLNRLFDHVERAALRPIRGARQKLVDKAKVQPGFVDTDRKSLAPMFNNCHKFSPRVEFFYDTKPVEFTQEQTNPS
jgi:hypothetical protein